MIRFENVSKVYPRSTRPALSDVSLEVERGEFVFVVGASGSGKSTLLRLVLKEENATQGTVLVAGQQVGRLPQRKVPRLRREIGTVFQDFRLLPNKTVYQNVAFALQVLGRSAHAIRQVVPETLEMVGLEGKEKRMLLDRINRTGTTIVMATHDDDIVNQLRKRVVELKNGHIIRDENKGVYGSGS
jgi:cell division transport system ATP-binding protein